MKFRTLFAAAGLAVAALGASVPAQAHRWHDDDDRYDNRRYDRQWTREDWRNNRRWQKHWRDREWRERHQYGWNNDRRCWTEWRRGRQVQVCDYY
jgi:hypothetical protein